MEIEDHILGLHLLENGVISGVRFDATFRIGGHAPRIRFDAFDRLVVLDEARSTNQRRVNAHL